MTPKALAAQPGQFFHLLCPSPDEGALWFRRPQSVYRVARSSGRIEFLYKIAGRGTKGLATLAPGDMLNMLGPLGVGFRLEPHWKNVVVLGRGVGLATMAPISQLAGERGVRVTAILSARRDDLAMGADLFESAGTVIKVLDTDGTSALENVEAILRLDHLAGSSARRRELVAAAAREGRCFVARRLGSLSGYAILDHNFFDNGFIALVYVTAEHRRRGVGSALVRFAEGQCRSAKLFTSTNQSNTPMRELLTKLGYEPSGVIENLEQGDSELIFFKQLPPH